MSKDASRFHTRVGVALAFSLIFLTELLLVAFLSIGGLPWLNNSSVNLLLPQGSALMKFSSYNEIVDFLNRSKSSWVYRGGGGSFFILGSEAKSAADSMNTRFSRTNIQVEGVDEADIVKTDGECVYLASNSKVLIVKAYPPEKAEMSAEILVNGTVSGLFINAKKLVVLSTNRYLFYYLETDKNSSETHSGRKLIGPWTHIAIYDVENPKDPILIRNVTISGVYFNSRMIDNYVYVLTSFSTYLSDQKLILPEIIDNNLPIKVDPASIYYSNNSDYYHVFTVVVAINIQDPDEPVNYETFLLGYSSCIYVSLNNIYITVPKYTENGEITEIHRIHIEEGFIRYEASGAVPGFVLNQFSMDEYKNYFRIATTNQLINRVIIGISIAPKNEVSLKNDIYSNIYVLDESLSIIGRIEGLAPGERIYSARFMGARCYLVTFKKIDPLFVISLEDPTEPRVLGKLKIPGYSDYLHPYDEDHLIGIGKWTVEAEEGDFAWYQGVKISLFDVSDVEHPKEIDSYVIGDRGTDSPVLRDHKALLFDKNLNLLAIPVLVAEIDESKDPEGVPPNAYGDYVWQGLYVFNITESKIEFKGGITHIEDQDAFLKSGYWFYSEYAVKRALYINNVLYTISDKMIKMNDLTSLEEIGSLLLP